MMEKKNQPFKKTPIYKNTRSFYYLILIQSFTAALWLLLIPKEPEHAVLLGYSLKRLALLLPIFLLPAIGFVVTTLLERRSGLQAWILDERRRLKTARLMVMSGFLLALMIWVFAFFIHFLRFFPDIGAYIRLLPVLSLYFLFGIEAVLFVPFFLFRKERFVHKKKADWKLSVFWISVITLISIYILIELTGLGKSPVWVSTTPLGIPLLEGQIWFLCGVFVLMIISAYAWSAVPGQNKGITFKQKDLLIIFSLWLLALMLWMSLPLPEHNYFAPSVRPPNFEKYPFSDAEQYDYNSLYVYFGSIKDFVVSKPLYVSFLAILHAIGGYKYNDIIFLQTIIIAFFPAVLYLIGKELYSRLGGFGIGLLAILREVNAIQASTMANVSNSKLLLSDMLATLVVAIMVLVIIRWFKYSEKRLSSHIFIVGGLTAMLNLMRIQTMALIPFILLLIIIRYYKQPKKILLSSGIFLLTVGVLLAPILIRNHSITDVYWLDNPSSSHGLYKYFLVGSDLEVNIPDAQTSADLVNRNFTIIFKAFSQNLKQTLLFISDNYFRNLISTMLILPVRLGNNVPVIEYLTITHPFWAEVYSQPNILNAFVVSLNILMIALGYAAVHKKYPWSAFVILLVYSAYNLSSAVVRLSGWRFIQPVDWIILVFFAIGILECIIWALEKIFKRDLRVDSEMLDEKSAGVINPKSNAMWNVGLGLMFFTAGAFIPLRESLLPSSYPQFNRVDACTEIETLVAGGPYSDLTESIAEFCAADDTILLKGFGFYPRFFDEGEGYYDRSYDHYFGKQDYSRIVFRIAGQRNGKVYIKTDESDIQFENGALVYVLGRDEPKFEAQMVIVGEENPHFIISGSILDGDEMFSLE
jgi:hypothetical protein